MRSSTSQRVGFYGCNGRAIRVASSDGLKPDRRRHRVSCPGCGHAHDVSPAWPHDATGHAEVVLPA